MVHASNGTLPRQKQERRTDTGHSADEPRRHYVEGKKPDPKAHILDDSIDTRCAE